MTLQEVRRENSLSDLFIKRGQQITLESHYRFLLEDEKSLYFFEEGNIDLFFSESIEEDEKLSKLLENDTPFTQDKIIGKNQFFKEISKSALLFPFSLKSKQKHHLIARASSKSTIYKLSQTDFINFLLDNPEKLSLFQRELNQWLKAFIPFFKIYHLDYPSCTLPKEGIIEFESSSTFVGAHRNDQDVMWLQPVKGNFFLVDNQYLDLKKGVFTPLITEMWFKATSQSALNILPPDSLSPNSLFEGLHEFHKNFVVLLEKLEEQNANIDAARLKQAIEQDQSNVKESITELDHILDKAYFFKSPGKNVLFNTCQLIGDLLYLKFTEPKEQKKISLFDELGALCLDSHIYYRKVKLKENWWKGNLGPLLGFYGIECSPVALVWMNECYRMVNTEEKTIQIVNLELDRKLALDACMFYRSLPNKAKLSGNEILSYGLRNNRKEMGWTLFYGLISMGLALLIPFSTSLIFSSVIPYSEETLLWQLSVGLILITLSSGVFKFFRETATLRFQGLLTHDLQTAVWQRIYSLPAKFFRKYEVGDLIQRASFVDTIQQKVAGPNLRVLINALFSILYLIPMFYYSPFLGGVALAIGLFGVGISVWAMFKAIKINNKVFALQGAAGSLVLQFIFGISKVRLAGAENLCFVLWEKIFYKIKKLQWPLEKVNNFAFLGNFAVSNISQVAIYAAAFYLVQSQIESKLLPGYFIAFMAAYIPFSYAINALCLSLLDISTTLGAWKRSLPIFEQVPEFDPLKIKTEKLSGKVHVDHVTFSYDLEGKPTLEDVSIKADPGEFIAIVGSSGSGKSSLIRLLIGFETPQSGSIYYDNKDLKSLDIHDVRRQIGTVLQTSTLLSGSIRQNIMTGAFYTDEEIEEAFKVSSFDVFMKELPMGLETLITNDGGTFSGGQKQRLMIARALIGKPKILIFDEATSALDNKTQDLLTKNLDKLNITRIVIAHRLSTIQNADRIYVLDKGKVVEEGTFDQLAEQKGPFSLLLKKQKMG